jgi:hypothetical protein
MALIQLILLITGEQMISANALPFVQITLSGGHGRRG